MSDNTPFSIRAAQMTALLVSAVASGTTLGLSVFVVPRLLESPTPLMLRQWVRTLETGRRFIPPFGEAAALSYLYLAYRYGLRDGLAGRLYLVAGGLCSAIIPYTIAVMMPTNRRLLKKAEDAKQLGIAEELVEIGARQDGAKYLVDQWGLLNLGRAALLLAANAVGLAATL